MASNPEEFSPLLKELYSKRNYSILEKIKASSKQINIAFSNGEKFMLPDYHNSNHAKSVAKKLKEYIVIFSRYYPDFFDLEFDLPFVESIGINHDSVQDILWKNEDFENQGLFAIDDLIKDIETFNHNPSSRIQDSIAIYKDKKIVAEESSGLDYLRFMYDSNDEGLLHEGIEFFTSENFNEAYNMIVAGTYVAYDDGLSTVYHPILRNILSGGNLHKPSEKVHKGTFLNLTEDLRLKLLIWAIAQADASAATSDPVNFIQTSLGFFFETYPDRADLIRYSTYSEQNKNQINDKILYEIQNWFSFQINFANGRDIAVHQEIELLPKEIRNLMRELHSKKDGSIQGILNLRSEIEGLDFINLLKKLKKLKIVA